ncbi:histidine kinase [Caulobacter sp. 17J65-9]|uniref:histidine kinase n=1 Tax=Caulobacter sp. 17J65-9 TaxID=2709382 RepID=UPI0013C74015|nr:histidine kinase [Caulobacter sp. 17J65-9]
MREAAALALGLWGTAYVVYLTAGLANDGAMAGFNYLMYALMAGFGLVPSALIYLTMSTTERMRLAPRLAVIGVCLVGTGLLHALNDSLLFELFFRAYRPRFAGTPLVRAMAGNFLILVWLHALYAAGVELVRSARATRERDRLLSEARAAAHQAQLAALRFQLNPHFLFNTLNAVSTLVVTHRNAEAETMIGRLCEFLRASLASDPQATTPLAEEMATVEAYLEIESVRFGERLRVEMAWPPELETAAVPGLVLQPLVENAVKYAVAPARRPVTIRVAAAERDGALALMVEDDGDAGELAADHAGTGVGLENVRRRLTALYGADCALEAGRVPGGGWRVALRLPLNRTNDARRAA